MVEKIFCNNAQEQLQALEAESVNVCVTSPPYYGLRDYGVAGQIGTEETLEEYIDHLVDIFRQVRRVLRPDGTLWLNIGDCYATGTRASRQQSRNPGVGSNRPEAQNSRPRIGNPAGCKTKDLVGVPWALAFALRADGWYLRQDIIWHKTNAMPESVRDRCTKAHEYVFLLSKSERYYFDAAAIREPCGTKGNARTFRGSGAYTGGRAFQNSACVERGSHGNGANSTGARNKRSVWSIATKGFRGPHFATFPEKLVEPCVLAGCPVGGVVLDPFAGTGTTCVVAKRLGRQFLGIEIKPEYAEMAIKRLNDTTLGLGKET